MIKMKPRKSTLDNLKADESKAVLSRILAHPNLKDETDRIARSVISEVSFESIAEEVKEALQSLDLDDLNGRAGSHSWGYVEPTEAAWELLEEEIEPFLEEMKRRLMLGFQKEALDVCKGILMGLYHAGHKEGGEVLGWAPDFPAETAGYVLEEWKDGQKNMTFPRDFVERCVPEWMSFIKRFL